MKKAVYSQEQDADGIEAAFARSGRNTRVIGGTMATDGESHIGRFDLHGDSPNADAVMRVSQGVGKVIDVTENTITIMRRPING